MHATSLFRSVTTAIKKECKGSIQVRQVEHVSDHETGVHASGLGVSLRLFDGQRRHIDGSYVIALPCQPEAVGSRSTAEFECAARLDSVFAENAFQFRAGSGGVPGEIAVAVGFVPISRTPALTKVGQGGRCRWDADDKAASGEIFYHVSKAYW